jgi:phosphatidylglycerophosphate synthase
LNLILTKASISNGLVLAVTVYLNATPLIFFLLALREQLLSKVAIISFMTPKGKKPRRRQAMGVNRSTLLTLFQQFVAMAS